MDPRVSLSTLFWIFFRIALTSFGGFMAMIAVVQNVVVDRKKLMSREDMLDGISLASILPGPVAVNLVAYVGYKLRGGVGATVSAVAAILPSFIIIVFLSIAYFRYGQIPVVSKILQGFLPAMTAIIFAAAWNMARKSATGIIEWALVLAAAAVLLGVGGFFSTFGIILGAGVIGWLVFREGGNVSGGTPPATPGSATPKLHVSLLVLASAPLQAAVPLLTYEPSLLLKIFLTFAGMSLMLFGGAYVFIPLIQEIVVEGHGWVTQQEFIDAVAMGQTMPGPILVSSAFVGLKVAGLAGAFVATLGIYVPAAVLMIVSTRGLDFIKRSVAIKAALKGVRPAVVGMIFAAAISVGQAVSLTWVSLVIFSVALVALLKFKVEAVWVIPAAGLVGWLFY
jgi:chromate transporter